MRIDRLSASKIKTYDSCAFKYFLNYGIYAPQKPHFAAEMGSLLHVILERYAQIFINGVDEEGKDKEWLDKNWKKMVLKDGFQTLKSWEYNTHVLKEAKDCGSCKAFKDGVCGVVKRDVDSFDGCPWGTWVEACNMVNRVVKDETEYGVFSDPSKVIGAEQKFNFDIELNNEAYNVNGIIDLVLEVDEDTVEIVDYKTGRHKMSPNAAQQDVQLMLYYLAAKKLYPEKKHHIVTVFYVHGGKKQITPSFSSKTADEIMEKVSRTWSSIKNDQDPIRIADRRDGSVSPNHVCKYLCNWDLCQKVKPKFDEYRNKGGLIEDLKSLEDLGLNEDGDELDE